MNQTESSFGTLVKTILSETKLKSGDITKAEILNIGVDYITVDAGLKSEADIPTSEFIRNSELQVEVGDEVEVIIEQIEHGDGVAKLSREKAHKAAIWIKLETIKEKGELAEGIITDRVKGGFTVEIDNVRAFLPGSQADIKIKDDQYQLSDELLQFKIINMDKKRNNIVVSRKAVLDSVSQQDIEELLNKITEGSEIDGVIKNLTDYGAFVELGGIDGLLHITDISWKRVKHPSEVLEVGKKVKVKVLSFDKEKRRVSLGMKQLCNDPWEGVASRYEVNSRVFGNVTNITDYGCFIEIENGIEGLVHMSEMDWTNRNVRPSKIVNIGDEVEVMILDVDESKRRISMGIKQCVQNPWIEFCNNNEMGQTISGVVKSITDFGIFVGLDGGIDGLVHITDVSWVKSSEEAIKEFKKGDAIEAKIVAIDADRERISLSIKDMSEDPFENYITENGNKIIGKVVEIEAGKNVIVEINGEFKGTIKIGEFKHNELPSIGDEVTAYVGSKERKSHLIELTLDLGEAVNSMHKSESNKSSSSASKYKPKSATLGDLIKGKIPTSESRDN